jgi:hypothetical protein
MAARTTGTKTSRGGRWNGGVPSWRKSVARYLSQLDTADRQEPTAHKQAVLAAVLIGALPFTSAYAQTPDSVQNRLGTLSFENGYPSEETARKLVWLSFAASAVHTAEDTIKVGILHSFLAPWRSASPRRTRSS